LSADPPATPEQAQACDGGRVIAARQK